MRELNLQKAPAVLKSRATLLASGTQNRISKVENIAEVKLILEIDVADHVKGIDWLFPGIEEHCKRVAGLPDYKGEDRTARGKLPEMNVIITYQQKQVLSQLNCPIKGKAKLKINDDGDPILVIQPLVKMNGNELTSIVDLIEADVRVSIEPSQVDIESIAPLKIA